MLPKKPLIAAVILYSMCSFGQEGKITVNRDVRIDSLLKMRGEILKEDIGFQIQIYSGNRDSAFTIIAEARALFTNNEVTVHYQTPNYKVWVGKFPDRLAADRFLIEIKKTYPNAFVLKPINRD